MTNYEYIRENFEELKKRDLLHFPLEWRYRWYQKYKALVQIGYSKKDARSYMINRITRMTFYRLEKYFEHEC